MIVQVVKFTSSFTEEEVLAVAREREPDYRRVPGLIQKAYVRYSTPDTYGGILFWESTEAMTAFRETELAQTIASGYGAVSPPEVSFGDVFMLLRADQVVAA